jgi:hypothetical protein
MEKTADIMITQDPEKAQELLLGSEVKETIYGDRYLILKENETKIESIS